MKKLIPLFVILILGLSGCGTIKQAVTDIKDCLVDRNCAENSQNEANKGREIGTLIGGGIPVPAAPLVAGSGLYFIFLIASAIKYKQNERKNALANG